MSFAKADQLLQLALMLCSRLGGLTLDEVETTFACSRRTAQRMFGALEGLLPELESAIDDDRRKRWRLPKSRLRDLITLLPEELASLDLAHAALSRDGQNVEAAHLASLRDKILALVPTNRAARLETDHEALLEAQGLAARPGPRQQIDASIAAAVTEAIKACRLLEIDYRSRGEPRPRRRRIVPYGVLTGLRRYVVAKAADDAGGPMRLYRMGDISKATVAEESFARDPGFNLQAFANRAFGTYQTEAEFGPVAWRFAPEAAADARGFEFHPGQAVEEQPDGSLIVRFDAAGHLEMCWYLYAWGDKVEILEPEPLRRLCHAYRRSDFPATP